MGSEFGQWQEWRDHEQLDWYLLEQAPHRHLRDFCRELNHLYLASAAVLTAAIADSRRISMGGFAQRRRERLGIPAALHRSRTTGAPLHLHVQCDTGSARPVFNRRRPSSASYRKILDSDEVRIRGLRLQQTSRRSRASAEGYQGFVPFS
jgi:1,4-alpha-glucan branching enzyme